MKEQIREKDGECVQCHLTRMRVDTAIARLREDVGGMEQRLRETLQGQCTLENQMIRARYLKDMGEAEVAMLGRSIQRIETDHRALEYCVHKKYYEATLLKAKVRVLSSEIEAEADTYAIICTKVSNLKAGLDGELCKIAHLQARGNHRGVLKLEELRLQKQLLEARGKVRALEDELEVPVNVHRWRFLEGTNPDQFQLIKMTHALRGKCMLKIAELVRLRAQVQETKREAELQARHLVMTSHADQEGAVDFFNGLLREKGKQLEILGSQVSGQQFYVEDSKSNVDILRSQLRDARGAFYAEKRSVDDLRAKSEFGRMSEGLTRPKYIGGGFQVASLTRRSLEAALKHTPTSLVSGRSSVLVLPKLSPGANLLPKHWNPIRNPLQPK
jgi:hypothetical protein